MMKATYGLDVQVIPRKYYLKVVSLADSAEDHTGFVSVLPALYSGYLFFKLSQIGKSLDTWVWSGELIWLTTLAIQL